MNAPAIAERARFELAVGFDPYDGLAKRIASDRPALKNCQKSPILSHEGQFPYKPLLPYVAKPIASVQKPLSPAQQEQKCRNLAIDADYGFDSTRRLRDSQDNSSTVDLPINLQFDLQLCR